MRKQKLLEHLISKIKDDIAHAEQASQASKEHATSSELKSEGKYDTRGIEAGYLAGAQEKRLNELKQELQLLEEIELKEFCAEDEIGMGALIELEFNQIRKLYFLTSTGGGALMTLDEQPVMVISVFSPIGSEVLGLKKDEVFIVEQGKKEREYRVINVE